jgi:peroxiredoxin (alkyl hydroperoxide reductase subunit C)
MLLVQKEAPAFESMAVFADNSIRKFTLEDVPNGQKIVLFFYPLDFTFVCPSELIALNHRMAEFKQRNVEVIAISIDSQFTHNAYRQTAVKDGGIGPVDYALVADMRHEVCQAFGVEHPVAGVALRAAFVIDKQGLVRSQIVNDLPIGRNIDEIIRIIDAVQFFETNGEVCPAGWQKGNRGMKASPTGVAEYLAANADKL